MQTITIEGVETKATKTGNTKTVLICREGKFYFYRNTKTGVSKAQEQFNKYGFTIGNIVEAEVQTEDKTFTNPKGDEITYKDNWIKFFAEVENTPVVSNVPVQPESPSQVNFEANNNVPDVQETIKKMRVAFQSMVDAHKALEMRVSGLETIVADLTSKDAVDLHQSFNIETPEGL